MPTTQITKPEEIKATETNDIDVKHRGENENMTVEEKVAVRTKQQVENSKSMGKSSFIPQEMTDRVADDKQYAEHVEDQMQLLKELWINSSPCGMTDIVRDYRRGRIPKEELDRHIQAAKDLFDEDVIELAGLVDTPKGMDALERKMSLKNQQIDDQVLCGEMPAERVAAEQALYAHDLRAYLLALSLTRDVARADRLLFETYPRLSTDKRALGKNMGDYKRSIQQDAMDILKAEGVAVKDTTGEQE